VAVSLVRIERGRAAVDDEELAGADRVVDRAQRAHAKLPDLVERRLISAAAGALEENALQARAAVARDF
jgi:hypothetical protein